MNNLLALAVVMRMEGNFDGEDHHTQIVLRDTRAIADLYLERFQDNYASTGQAWATDLLLASDTQLCKAITEG